MAARLTLLGPVTLVDDSGDLIPLGGRRPAGILAALALRAPRSMAVDTLIQAIWGDRPPSTARNAVQVSVSGLRKILDSPGARIESLGDGYAFVPGQCVVDALEFERGLSEGSASARTGDLWRAVGVLEQALQAWTGSALAGLDGLWFVDQAREVLADRWARGQSELSACLLSCGRFDDAAASAAALLEQRPFDEAAWAVLAEAHYHAGRQAQSLEVLRAARLALADELGIDPGVRLRDLETAVLRQDVRAPGQARPAGSDPPDVGGTLSGSQPPALPALPVGFVGREDAVASVIEVLDAGERLISLVGLGGIGKTTLAAAVAQRVALRGAGVSFHEAETASTPGEVFTVLCRDLGLDPENDPVSTLARWRPSEPHLCVVDNVEQVPELGTVLSEALARVPGLAVLVTSRTPLRVADEFLVRVPALAVRGPDGAPGPAVELLLRRLGRRGSSTAASLARADDATVRAAIDICGRVEGIPLAIELVAGRGGVLTVTQLASRVAADPALVLGAELGREADRQASLQAVLTDAVAPLSSNARRLLEGLAALGSWVPSAMAEALVESWAVEGTWEGPVDPAASLDELDLVGLVEVDGQGRSRVPVPVREFLARRPGAPQATRVATRAVCCFVEANNPGPGAAEVEAVALIRQGYEAVRLTLAGSVAAADADASSRISLGLGRFWLLSNRLHEGLSLLVDVSRLDHPDPLRATRVRLLAGAFASYVHLPDAEQWLDEALAEAEALGSPPDRLVVNGYCCRAALSAARGSHEEALSIADCARKAAQMSGDHELVSLARDLTGYVASFAGDHETALRVGLEGVADARRSGSIHDLVILLANVADMFIHVGLPEEAQASIDEAYSLLDAGGPEIVHSAVVLIKGIVDAVQGNSASAHGSLLAVLRAEQGGAPDEMNLANALFTLGAVHADLGRFDEAARCFGAASAYYTRQGVDSAGRTAPACEQRRDAVITELGARRYDLMAGIGQADPDGVVRRLLTR